MTQTAILVGNPNVGKSALFGALTGRWAKSAARFIGEGAREAARGAGLP